MKNAATLLIAALIVIVAIIALNALCAGCVYAWQDFAPESRSGILAHTSQPYPQCAHPQT